MTNTLQIESIICGLTGIQFEVFVRELVSYSYSNILNIEHPGKKEGNIVPSHSKTDLWIEYEEKGSLHNDFYAITTDKSNGVFGEKGKVTTDIEKLIHFIKETGPYDNPRIIYAITREIDPSVNRKYVLLCKEQGIDFSFLGLGTIVDLVNKNKDFQLNHYGIFQFSGSVVTLDIFLKHHVGQLDFSQTFCFREDLQKTIAESVIKENNVVLFGPSGCGKTRLAVEVSKELQRTNNFRVYVVKQSNASVIDDLKQLYCSDQSILFLVDDANKNNFISDILNFAEQYNNVYIIFTVRNYAYRQLEQRIVTHKFKTHEIKSLSNNQIETILKNSFSGFKDEDVIKYILSVSKGNLRFALITAQVIAGEQKKYDNLADIVESFYKALFDDLELAIRDENFENFLCAISFFETLNIDDSQTVANLSSVFGFDGKRIKKYISLGNEKEIVDTDELETTINMSDQIFATYICYKKIYKYREITLQSVFDNFFKDYPGKVVSLVQSILDIYEDKCEIIDDIKSIYMRLLKESDARNIIGFLNAFQQIVPNDAINYAYSMLKGNNYNNASVKSLIGILTYDRENDNFYRIIVDKYVELLKENLDIRNELIAELSNSFSIKRKSIYRNYATQIYLISTIKSELPNDFDVLTELIKCFIGYSKDETELTSKSNTFTMYRFELVITSNYKLFRELLWNLIESIIISGNFSKISEEYMRIGHISKSNYQLRQIDYMFAKVILSSMSKNTLEDKITAFNLLIPFRKMEEAKAMLDSLFETEIIRIYHDYINEFTAVHLYGDNLENSIKKALEKYTSYSSLVEDVSIIHNLFSSEFDWKITSIINSAFSIIKANEEENYNEYLIMLFSKIKGVNCNLVEIIDKSPDKPQLLKLLLKENCTDPFVWSPLFLSYDREKIDKEVCKMALSFFSSDGFMNKSKIWGNEGIINLVKYTAVDPLFIHSLCKHYLDRGLGGSFFLESLLFGTKTIEELMAFLDNDDKLLAGIYFEQIKDNHFFDNNFAVGGFLSSLKSDYFDKCVEYIVKHKANYGVVKLLFNREGFIDSFMKVVDSSNHLSFDFSIQKIIENMPDDVYASFIDEFINRYKNNQSKMFSISSLVGGRNAFGRLTFLDKCISNDVEVPILRSILIMEGPNSWTNSFYDCLKKDYELFESYVNNYTGTKYREYLDFHLEDLKRRLRYVKASETNKNDW